MNFNLLIYYTNKDINIPKQMELNSYIHEIHMYTKLSFLCVTFELKMLKKPFCETWNYNVAMVYKKDSFEVIFNLLI